MSEMRVVVADDEPLVRERVCALVRESSDLQLVYEAANGLEALTAITRLKPDLVFIDIEMPVLGGFGVIAALDESMVPAVVFVTAFEHYAVKAFDVGAVDYLHKPITPARFSAAVRRARDRLAQRGLADRQSLIEHASAAERAGGYRTRFVVLRGSAYSFVPVKEVDWIDVADNYLQLHVGARTHLSRGTMKQAEEELDPSVFIRVHRSHLVAIDQIETIRAHESGGFIVRLRSGSVVRASRQYAERVRGLLGSR